LKSNIPFSGISGKLKPNANLEQMFLTTRLFQKNQVNNCLTKNQNQHANPHQFTKSKHLLILPSYNKHYKK